MATKDDLDSAKLDQGIIDIQRRAKLAAWNDYISFATSKLTGLAGVVCGGLDLLNPTLIPHIPHPDLVLGSGLALLTGKSMMNLLSKVVKGLS